MNFQEALRCVAVAALPVVLSGCGGSANSGSETASTGAAERPTASATATPGNAGSVTSATVVDGQGTAPAQSVAVFLDSLRRGDETAANAMLTSKARSEMGKTSYVLQPLGTPEGEFKIGRVGFPYEDKSVALVECMWTEPGTAQEPAAAMEIVCEVHQETEGWRISGLGVTMSGTEEALVLDFEDAASLQATIDAATGQTTAASLATENAAVPPLPSFPNGTDAPSGAGQIAMPPANGGPVLR